MDENDPVLIHLEYIKEKLDDMSVKIETHSVKIETHIQDSVPVRADVVQNNCARIKYYAELEDAHKNTEFREGFWKHASVFYVSVIGGVVSLFAWGIKKIIGG